MLLILGLLFGMLAPLAPIAPAYAASVSSAVFTGDASTVSVGGTLYAKKSATLTLTVTTSDSARCVDVGTFATRQTSAAKKTSWTFTGTAPHTTTTETKSYTVTVGEGSNNDGCRTHTAKTTAAYILDNQGPALLPSNTDKTGVSPAPNAAGWNNSNVTITWSATDSGSSVNDDPSPKQDTVTANYSVVDKIATAKDKLGNEGKGLVTIKLDKSKPVINFSTTPQLQPGDYYNGTVTVNYSCDDPQESSSTTEKGSGIKSCTNSTASPNSGSVTLNPGDTVTITAVDNADNNSTVTVGPFNVDNKAPTLTGAPTTDPNGTNGWYTSDVTIGWKASDAESGIDTSTLPAGYTTNADGSYGFTSKITGEGTALTANASVSDKVKNSTNAASSPAVKIDKTAPSTSASAPQGWNNGSVTVELTPAAGDLSGIAATRYKLDDSAEQTYNSTNKVSISTEGVHTLSYYSVDNAGNKETAKSIQVKIDKTPPTIEATGKTADDAAYTAGAWTNQNVAVTFECGDTDGSGIASCVADGTDPASSSTTVSTEGGAQDVTGTATDNAGNTAKGHFGVSIDKTKPTIEASKSGVQGSNGWYTDDVTVNFACADPKAANGTDGSGIAKNADGTSTCPVDQKLGEGKNQSASGTVKDVAGNSASASVSGIDVDKTAPTLTGAPTTDPNGAGWYKGDVTIGWTCSDTLSGIATTATGVSTCPANSTITGEGIGLKAGESVSDKAGNSANATSSPAVKIDSTAPTTSVQLDPAQPLESGWYAGAVTVTLSTAADLSGVDKTYYSVDGATTEYTAPFSHDLKGEHTITFWSTDLAGNTENKSAPGHSVTIKIDGVPPTIEGTRSPEANNFGWNNASVDVSFDCEDAESGIAYCNGAATLGEGAGEDGNGQSVTGTATDNAGNSASATVSGIKIDQTAPELNHVLPDPSGEDKASPANSWYNTDVSVGWSTKDGLSGIDPATQPDASVVRGEGRNLVVAAGAVSVSDKAGNSTSNGQVSRINIDRTGPTITSTKKGTLGANGWYKGAVTVDFQCADPNLADGSAGSGVASCPTSQTLEVDGTNLSVTSGQASDYAKNSTAGIAVGGINIDGHEPITQVNNNCGTDGSFCQTSVTLVFTATDQGPSGMDKTYYGTDNKTWTAPTAATCAADAPAGATCSTATVALSGTGTATVYFYSVDKAGNKEQTGKASINYDNIAPAVWNSLYNTTKDANGNYVKNPSNSAGWNNRDVLVHWDAKDDDGGSGVDPSKTTPDKTVMSETSGVTYTGQATDKAGNTGYDDPVTVKLDKTAPTISAAMSPSAPDGSNGWYRSAVTVSFTCSDALSGIPTDADGKSSCPDSVTLSGSGTNQSASGTVYDAADNKGSVTSAAVRIDVENPTIASVNVANGFYRLGGVPSATCEATDSFSGVASCTVKLTAPTSGVGTGSYTATATDNAGNVSTQTGTYTVVYRFDKFLQPINDTAHTGAKMSIFKAGSTVPVKFQLKKADGTVVQASSDPVFVNLGRVNLTTGGSNSTSTTATANTSGTFRYDSTSQQYIYNWKSPNEPNVVYRIGVRLEDGQTYTVDIGLK